MAPTVEVEAIQVESLDSQGLLHGEVSWILMCSIFSHDIKLLNNLFEF